MHKNKICKEDFIILGFLLCSWLSISGFVSYCARTHVLAAVFASVCLTFTNAMLFHQCYEVGLGEELWRARLSVQHLDSRRLELGALFVHRDHLKEITFTRVYHSEAARRRRKQCFFSFSLAFTWESTWWTWGSYLCAPLIVRINIQVIPLNNHESRGGERLLSDVYLHHSLLSQSILGYTSQEVPDDELIHPCFVPLEGKRDGNLIPKSRTFNFSIVWSL